MRYAALMEPTDYDPATRRRLGIDPPLQRSIGNQDCPGCGALASRLDELERMIVTSREHLEPVERCRYVHATWRWFAAEWLELP